MSNTRRQSVSATERSQGYLRDCQVYLDELIKQCIVDEKTGILPPDERRNISFSDLACVVIKAQILSERVAKHVAEISEVGEKDETDIPALVKVAKRAIEEDIDDNDMRLRRRRDEIRNMVTVKPPDDDEIETVEVETHVDSEYTCPVTGMKIIEAMKCSKCKHHISKAGVELLSKRSKDFPCPFTGCRAKWSMNDVSRDREFDILVERHFRLREASGSSSSQHCAVPLELDDDE